MSPEDRRRLVEAPFPTVRIVASQQRCAGTTVDAVSRSYRSSRYNFIQPEDTSDAGQPDYFSKGVYASMSDTEKTELWRRQWARREHHVRSCGRVR